MGSIPARRASILLTGALLLPTFGAASAEAAQTLRVSREKPDLVRTLLAAVPGDTVLVGPGDYTGGFRLPPEVALLSTDGPDSTILRGDFIYTLEIVGGEVEGNSVVRGFRFDCRRGAEIGVTIKSGYVLFEGNVVVKAHDGVQVTGRSEPLLRANRFEACARGLVVEASTPRIEENEFVANVAAIDLTSSSPAIQRNRFRLNREAIALALYSYPVIGGGLSQANDFVDNRVNLSNRALSTVGSLRTQDRVTIAAKYNYWGTLCPPAEKFIGPCRWRPWTDAAHQGHYIECPDSAAASPDSGSPSR